MPLTQTPHRHGDEYRLKSTPSTPEWFHHHQRCLCRESRLFGAQPLQRWWTLSPPQTNRHSLTRAGGRLVTRKCLQTRATTLNPPLLPVTTTQAPFGRYRSALRQCPRCWRRSHTRVNQSGRRTKLHVILAASLPGRRPARTAITLASRARRKGGLNADPHQPSAKDQPHAAAPTQRRAPPSEREERGRVPSHRRPLATRKSREVPIPLPRSIALLRPASQPKDPSTSHQSLHQHLVSQQQDARSLHCTSRSRWTPSRPLPIKSLWFQQRMNMARKSAPFAVRA